MVKQCDSALSNHVDLAYDAYKYPSINDITREDNGLVYGEVNVSDLNRAYQNSFLQL